MGLMRRIARKEIAKELNDVKKWLEYLATQAEGNLRHERESQIKWGLKSRIDAYHRVIKNLENRITYLK